MGNEVLFYVPNIIGYVRILLLVASLFYYDKPLYFLILYGVSVALDALDGILARKLNQTSVFGAWFDVLIDLVSRGALWCFISKWGYFVMMIEWLTFVCTHSRGSNWKIPDEEFPSICKLVMAKGFKTPVGAYAITGIFVLPLWIYGMMSGFLLGYLSVPVSAQYCVLILLIGGRLLALTTEVTFIFFFHLF
ncbi:uncharacterized protein LOC132759023, partial [Ruditapes philippinarum]|uniref:uncharacterized protein LOC132759023 n=1 Tax=Ruditapes philippinarum TaxID=129788 RepID=UPI00295BFC50